MKEEYKLDNPVWYSLSETHHQFAIAYENIKFYHPDFCPFGGFVPGGDISNYISEYARLVDNFYIVGEKPAYEALLKLKNELVCLQMICHREIAITFRENIVELGHEHQDELLKLVNLVQPGYFKKKTALLGHYYGIFKDNTLIAVTGERMRMNAYTEVSAVVTHPDNTGRGYAKQLVAFTANNILAQKQVPILHVAETNVGAIDLYKKLGFETRRKISFWNIINP